MQGREIKFRIWDKDLKKMRVCGTDIHDSIAFDMDNNAVYYNMQNGCGSLADGTGTYDLMQFTGLRDKNGKEIYEGDILTSTSYPFQDDGKYNYHGIVEWDDEYAAYFLTTQLVNSEKRGALHGVSQTIMNYEMATFEVIGNIYENPELLEVGE